MSGIIAQNVGRHTGLVKAAGGGGAWNLIQTLTSDGSDADLSFTSGIDSTYDEYCFMFINIHPEENSVRFETNFRDGSTAYDASKTTTMWRHYHDEDGSPYGKGTETGFALANDTGNQTLSAELGYDNDQHTVGYLYLFNPSSTTFTKSFTCWSQTSMDANLSMRHFASGYLNVTAAIDGVTFVMSSGEIQAGSISMYGIS